MIIKCRAKVARMVPQIAEFEFEFDTGGEDYLEDHEYYEWISDESLSLAKDHFKPAPLDYHRARDKYFNEDYPNFSGEIVELEMDIPKARSKTPPREINTLFQVQLDGSLFFPHEFQVFPKELAEKIKSMSLNTGGLYKVVARVKTTISGNTILDCDVHPAWLGEDEKL